MKFRLLLCILALIGLSAPAHAQIAAVTSPSGPVQAGPYVVIDADTGETLLDRNAGAFWHPASLTKMMTIYVVFEELKAGRLTLATPMALSEVARAKPPSKLGLGPGQGITVEQGLQALVARSANDVAAGFAELISGSEAAFGVRMTETAARIGMNATQFRNASGWPDPGQLTTARDMALLAMALVKQFPEYYGYFHTQEFYLGKTKVGPGIKFLDLYAPYADGLKTGFVCASGFNIVGSAVRDGRRLIAVAFGFRRADLRDEFIIRLLDEAYRAQDRRQPAQDLADPQRPGRAGHGARPGRVRHHPLRHAGRCGVARHLSRLALGAACLRCRPVRHRAARLHAARQGMDPAGHLQQGDQAGRHHRRSRARHGAGAVRRLPGAKIVLPGEETPGNHGAVRPVLALSAVCGAALAGASVRAIPPP